MNCGEMFVGGGRGQHNGNALWSLPRSRGTRGSGRDTGGESMSDHLFRFGRLDDTDSAQEYFHRNTYAHQTTSTGLPRLAIASKSPLPLFLDLADVLSPPFDVLYVLHTSRCSCELGRYQSPLLEKKTFRALANEFVQFLSTDGRHDVWLHSRNPECTLVWDRHNLIHAYGPLDRLTEVLQTEGLAEGEVSIPSPHTHHYHARFDDDERRILKYLDWNRMPLQPSDEQYQPGDSD
jgi:hypothetical protein